MWDSEAMGLLTCVATGSISWNLETSVEVEEETENLGF